MVEAYGLDGDGYRLVVTRGGTDRVRLEPFGAIEVELEALASFYEGVQARCQNA